MNQSGAPTPNLLTSDPEEIARLWYVAPKPQFRGEGWLVFTEEYVLAALQGRRFGSDAVSQTTGWRIVGALGVTAMAIAQLVLMLLAKIPVVSWCFDTVAQNFGRNYCGFFLRSCYWKAKLKKLGQCTLFDQGVSIWGPDRIEIGHDCFLGTDVRLSAGKNESEGSISIGDYTCLSNGSSITGSGQVTVGDFVAIMASTHVYSSTSALVDLNRPGQLMSLAHSAPRDRHTQVTGPVVIGDYAVIGANSVVLPNVQIGRGAVIHPFTEIARSFPAFANVTGPGRGKQNGWRRPSRLDPRLELETQPEEVTLDKHEGAEQYVG